MSRRPSSACARPSSAGAVRSSSRLSSVRTADRGNSGGVNNAGLPSTTKLPAELGLAGRRLVSLPHNVGGCDQGERCCWRWLAHSVLEEAAGLKEELDAVRKEQGDRLAERAKVEHDVEAHAELRGTHAEVQRELSGTRVQIGELRQERAAMRAEIATKAAREVELEREIARAEDDKLRTSEREAAANRRAQESEAILARTQATLEEFRKQISQQEIAQAHAAVQLAQVIKERDELQREREVAAEARRRKRNQRRSAMALDHRTARSKSATMPRFNVFP
mmetsp:Transcript_61926/g.119373  ORF Transcript_61926/g.119373 Transcript_61926/m.119373 type:complete len:279 (-) Transcript_61926:373-1209(-)